MTASDLTSWLIVVPARMASERLPGKPLADLGGRPMIVRVAQNLTPLAARGAAVLVATDTDAVAAACRQAGIRVVMTSLAHPSGTDRCAEAAQAGDQPLILNVQGDEPFVDCDDLAGLMAAMERRPEAAMGTLVHKVTPANAEAYASFDDPNVVKAVVAADGHALYFSRSRVPYDRGRPATAGRPESWWRHIGVYAYRRAGLSEFVALPPSPLEQTEKLEQLRALEHGWRILAHPARSLTLGIDTPADLEAARARLG